ncbi:MAG: hypothetical protein RLZZ58_892, partial [Pseudomonadota bacterium]
MRLLKLVPDNTNIPFLKWRNIAMAISFLTIIASIALVATRGLNLGVDFVGGQMVSVEFAKAPAVERLREKVETFGLGEATIQQFGKGNEFSIRTALPDGDDSVAEAAGRKLQAG